MPEADVLAAVVGWVGGAGFTIGLPGCAFDTAVNVNTSHFQNTPSATIETDLKCGWMGWLEAAQMSRCARAAT